MEFRLFWLSQLVPIVGGSACRKWPPVSNPSQWAQTNQAARFVNRSSPNQRGAPPAGFCPASDSARSGTFLQQASIHSAISPAFFGRAPQELVFNFQRRR